MKLLELKEEYNKEGICVRRTINGYELPPDKQPSVIILKNLTSVSQKFYLTEKEAEVRFGYLTPKPNDQ